MGHWGSMLILISGSKRDLKFDILANTYISIYVYLSIYLHMK